MEVQTTTVDNSAENMQVLQVLLELVHPQGGTVQIAQDADNIQIQAEECETEQMHNVSSISDLGSEGIVIAYDSVNNTLGTIQNQIVQQQVETNQTQGTGVYNTHLNTENVVFEVSGRQAERVAIPISTGATTTTPQSTMVEIPVLNTSAVKSKKSGKSKKTLQAIEERYQFECTLCKKLCKSQRSLEKHMQKELKMKPHTCEICSKRFKNVAGLQNHQKLHTGEKPYKCTICAVAFANRSTFNYHNELKHSDKMYICQCSKTFKTKACLRAHLKNHTFQGPKRYKCQYCGLRLKTKHYKNEHERIHTNERPYKCRQGCEKAFRRSGARNDHERTVHLKENKEPCKYCGHMYDKREIKNHEMVHTGEKPFTCPYCESRYTQRKVLNKHIRRKHPDEEVPQPPVKAKVEKFETLVKSTGKSKKRQKQAAAESQDSGPTTIQIQVYKCMYCVKLFNNIDHLAEHEKTHVKEHHYECSTCGKTFQRPEGLTRHEGKHAGGFRCYTCGKVFTTLTKMQEHHREHFFRCTLCKHKFQTKDKLDEHMKKHQKKKSETNTTPMYECQHCQKSFLRKVGLKEHERIHLDRIKCPLCEKMFVSYYLQKHLRTHSGDHPYTCSLCPNRHYTTPNALRTHMRRRHPVQKIEIKHKKGSETADIQVSEKPHNVSITTAEVTTSVEGTTDVSGERGEGESAVPIHLDITPEISEAPSLHMEVTPTTINVVPSVSNAIQTASEFGAAVPIEISSVIQQAAAANDIQMDQVVARAGEQVAQLVSEDGTITTMTIVDTLSQTGQETSIINEMETDGQETSIINEMETGQETSIINEMEADATTNVISEMEETDATSTVISEMATDTTSNVNLQEGENSQTGQEANIVREIDPNEGVTLQEGDQQIVFAFQ